MRAGKQGTRPRKSGRRRVGYISAAKRRALEDEEKSRRVDLRLHTRERWGDHHRSGFTPRYAQCGTAGT